MPLNPSTLAFIRLHADDDVRQLALRGTKAPDVDLAEALRQIAGRQQARRKLPTWASIDAIVYPPHLSLEQCSSEPAARYKARLVERLQTSTPPALGRDRMVDLTGGLGVDFSFLAPLFAEATYVERHEPLWAIARQNLPHVLAATAPLVAPPHADGTPPTPRLTTICADAAHYLHTIDHAALLYLDPARRDANGARTYDMADCTPDVLQLRDALLLKADAVLLKLSPMLDWRKTVADLGSEVVSEVHIVAVGGECKELLVVMSRHATGLTVSCAADDDVLTARFPFSELPTTFADAAPSLFLYEPNAAIMKAGCFAELCRRYAVSPLAPNSHLFVAPQWVADFPGRKFQISAVSSMNKKELKAKLGTLTKANITVRNFPMTVADLRKRLKLADGGSTYLFATTLRDRSHALLVCRPATAGA